MDLLTITVSVVAVATLADQTSAALYRLRETCKALPGRLLAVLNEITDLEAVLREVAHVTSERSRHLWDPSAYITHLLSRAFVKLTELKELVDKLETTCARAKIPLAKACAWQKAQSKLLYLQEDINTIKSSLNVLIGASNSYVPATRTVIILLLTELCRKDLMRVRLGVESVAGTTAQLTLATAEAVAAQNVQRDEKCEDNSRLELTLIDSIDSLYAYMDQRVAQVEDLIRSQREDFLKNQHDLLAPIYGSLPQYRRRRSRTSISSKDSSKSPMLPNMSEAISVRVTQYSTLYRSGCICACHRRKKSSTPRFVDQVLGQLFIGYAGMPFPSPKCDSDACEKAQTPHVSLEYWFPVGFVWSQIVRLQFGFRPNVGPQVSLSTLRRVPDSAQSVDFALAGNIDGLKDLFKNGLASPQDVSSTRGYSLLRICSTPDASHGPCCEPYANKIVVGAVRKTVRYCEISRVRVCGS